MTQSYCLSTSSFSLTPSYGSDTNSYIASVLLCPVSKVEVPFLNFPHSLSLYFPHSCFNISLYFFPSGTSLTQQLSSRPKLLGKEKYWLVGGYKICLQHQKRLCGSGKGHRAGRTKYNTNLFILDLIVLVVPEHKCHNNTA